jgi:hypothetical protein
MSLFGAKKKVEDYVLEASDNKHIRVKPPKGSASHAETISISAEQITFVAPVRTRLKAGDQVMLEFALPTRGQLAWEALIDSVNPSTEANSNGEKLLRVRAKFTNFPKEASDKIVQAVETKKSIAIARRQDVAAPSAEWGNVNVSFITGKSVFITLLLLGLMAGGAYLMKMSNAPAANENVKATEEARRILKESKKNDFIPFGQ